MKATVEKRAIKTKTKMTITMFMSVTTRIYKLQIWYNIQDMESNIYISNID